VKLKVAIPILLSSATVMSSAIGIAIAQEVPQQQQLPQQPPQVRIPRPGQRPLIPGQPQQPIDPPQQPGGEPQSQGKLRPFRSGLEDRPSGRVPPAQRLTFNLEDADLPELVRFISRITGKRFILPGKARSIKASVVADEPVTAAEAYRAFLTILDLNGMTIVPSGRFFYISETQGVETEPLPFYTDGQAQPRDSRFVTRMHRVRNVSAEDVATLLTRFKSAEGNVTAYAPTNTIIITDTGTNIQRMLRILQEVDVPRTGEQIWIEPIHYAAAADIAARLQEIFPTTGSGSSPPQGNTKARPAPQQRQTGGPPGEQQGSQTIGSRTGESRITSILPDERTNSLIILATERAYLRILEVIRALDIPVEGEGSIHVHALQYADSEEMASTLQALVGGQGSRTPQKSGTKQPAQQQTQGQNAGGEGAAFEGTINVQAHKATNSLLITSSLHDYAALRRVIERLDAAPRQVFIEAVIMELSVQRSSALGIAYHGGVPAPNIDGEDSLTVFGFDAARTATPSLSPDLLTGLAVGVRGPEIEAASELIGFSIPSFGVVLNAIANSGDVNVLSTPHIIAMDNVQAEITVGANVPLQTSGLGGGLNPASLAGLAGQGQQGQQGLAGLGALAGLGSLGGLGGGVQRQNVGTTIRVTPHINEFGEIRMELEEEISEVQPAQGTLGVVPISQRIAKTQVVMRDQQTVVIGGLMRDRVTTTEDKIPILGDIPLLGVLFRRQTTNNEKTNLILFLTPYIIRSPADLRAIFERKLRERQEFIDRYFVFSDRGYEPPMDYSRTRGLISEILNAFEEDAVEQRLLQELQARPPPAHVPRPPIGSTPFDHDGSQTIVIGPDGEEQIGEPQETEVIVEEPQEDSENLQPDIVAPEQ
jgi:general secretion pathway protein D